MSKKSCKAAESIEDALLRMARVNCNFCAVHKKLRVSFLQEMEI